MRMREKLALMVEMVTDIAMGDDGVATSKGTHKLGEEEGHELESDAGWHFGFYSRPKDGARGVVLKADGQGNTSFLFCYRDKQYEMSLEKGEVGIKGAFGGSILLDKNDDVIFNSGTKKIARVDDTAKADTLMATWMGQVEVALNSLAGGSVAPLASTFNATSIAKISTGADHVKA